MASSIIGANLRLARLFHGLTLDEVATRIGKSRQYVHKLETEQISPPEVVLNEIAQMTQVYPVFFSRPVSSPITEDQCHFRKHFTARAAVKHVAMAKGEMFRRLVSSVESKLELPKNNIPQFDVSTLVQIEQAAEACRRHWSLGLGPIQNMTRLVENVGAVVTTFVGISREVDAHSISGARPVIVVNADDSSACRIRFDIAHELAHLILHVGQVTGDRKTEGEANRFAGAFLLPRSSFVNEFPRLRGAHLNWQGLADMKLRWKVSKSALLYRAKQLSLISDDQYKTGYIRLSRGGEARAEKEDTLIPKERPELLAHAVSLARDHLYDSIDALCQELGVLPPILNEFVGFDQRAPQYVGGTANENSNVVSLFDRRPRRTDEEADCSNQTFKI